MLFEEKIFGWIAKKDVQKPKPKAIFTKDEKEQLLNLRSLIRSAECLSELRIYRHDIKIIVERGKERYNMMYRTNQY